MKHLMVLFIVVLTASCTTSTGIGAYTGTEAMPLMSRGALLDIDLRSADQIKADLMVEEERTTGSFLESIPVIGPILEAILSVTKGRISVLNWETRYDSK